MVINPEEIQNSNFAEVKKLLDGQIKKHSKNPVKCDKYKGMKKKVEAAEKAIETLIAKSKEIKMKSGKTFFEEFVESSE